MRHKWARLAAAVSLAAVLTACGMSPEAAAVQEMIDQMPETYSADIDDEIMNACNALDALSEDDKKAVTASRLEELEEAYRVHYQQVADEINEKIDALEKYETINQISEASTSQRRRCVDEIMQKIEELPDSASDMVHYDALLKNIQQWGNQISEWLRKANDLLVMESVFEDIQAINSAYSTSAKYSYACDIKTDLSGLSDEFSTEKRNLLEKAESLKDTCLYGEDFEITVATLDIISEASTLSESMSNLYDNLLNDYVSDFLDDCLTWEQTVKEKMGK